MSLEEYVKVSVEYCRTRHTKSCKRCPPLIAAARLIRTKGICPLSDVYKEVFPTTKYNAYAAKRRLLQLPLAAIRCGNPEDGVSRIYLMEALPGCDHLYQQIIDFYLTGVNQAPLSMTKDHLKDLLSLAQSDRERECIKYAVYKTSNLTPTAARRLYGLADMTRRKDSVEKAIEETKQIQENIEMLAATKDKAILLSHGIMSSTGDSSDDDTSSDDSGECFPDFLTPEVSEYVTSIDYTTIPLKEIVENSKSNFFQVAEELETLIRRSLKGDELDVLFQEVLSLPESSYDSYLIHQSYRALLATNEQSLADHQNADMVNGLVITDSESEDPEEVLNVAVLEEKKTEAVKKRREIMRRMMRRQRAKCIASARFLSRKVLKKVSKIVKKFPNIGKDIEKFVQERNVGADFWRRTGVLTFDGNRQVREKVTYERIRQHLQQLYQHHFSYGTVVQLCVARNKRRKSAHNYKALAKVTTRRARKGFTLKLNPDKHWSSAFYRGLNWLQYTDGQDILNVNRDDASGFRLDTLATHCQHSTPVVGETVTTRTDYVNKYSSVIQTTSYNFTGTNTTGEICAGIVKPSKVFPKNPAQHAADLQKLANRPELRPAFFNQTTGLAKSVTCVRVDGAGDEGPGHVEVQYYWTVQHIDMPTQATLVTSRSSGSSYLNRVELQNGCLSLAHTNLFIPSTLNGSCLAGGSVDDDKLTQNLMSAAEIYIQRCNHAPCGDAEIELYIGADSSQGRSKRSGWSGFSRNTSRASNLVMVVS